MEKHETTKQRLNVMMEKPRTTKQHLIDKLILGQLPIHKRHGQMKQYGGTGRRDQNLENAFASIEFDTTGLTIDKQCALRAKFFLEMVEIYIEQMEDALHQSVARYALDRLLAEDRQYITMDYTPEQLKDEKKEQYGTIENYQSILEKTYKQVVFENQVSKMFSSILDSVKKNSKESFTDSELDSCYQMVCQGIYNLTTKNQERNKIDEIYISGLSITPEEQSEFQLICKTKTNVRDILANIAAQRWIDEIQAVYEPDNYFYNGFFSTRIKARIIDNHRIQSKTVKPENQENQVIQESHTSQIYKIDQEYQTLLVNQKYGEKYEQKQILNLIIEEFLSECSPKEQKILEQKLLGATNAEIAEEINDESFEPSNVQYALKKLEKALEEFLRSKGSLGANESVQLLRKNKKASGEGEERSSKWREDNE